jgi:lipopolysaccharide/colanic/teichoic acid biosynthesis glycosyltransferase
VLANATRDGLARKYLDVMSTIVRKRRRQSGLRFFVKRTVDQFAGAVGLVAVAPILLPSMLGVRVTMGSPVLFKQERPGYKGRPFQVVKLRTMSDERDSEGRPLPDARRLSWLGRLLRATSIDELPQLWNVFRGDLSLVGPRPLLMQYLARYTPEQARRHEVMPGITGWAQVNGRNALSWGEKFEHDVWYVDHWSLGLDAKILVRTLWQTLARKGISNRGHATMPEFMGTEGAMARRSMRT